MDTINGITQPRTGDIAEAHVRRLNTPSDHSGEADSKTSPAGANPVAVDEASTTSTPQLTRQQVEDLVAELAAAMEQAAPDPRSVSFRHEEGILDFVIEITNRETGEMITQFPPEKILNMRERLDELVGMVIDRKI